MSAVYFLFARKLSNALRWALLITGYDTRQKDLVERLYGVYIGLIVAAWGVLMLAWSVTTLAAPLEALKIAPADVAKYAPFLFAFWLAIVPWMAGRGYNVYRFTHPDLDFLSASPVPVPLVALAWYAKSMMTRFNGVVVLGCGILASALSVSARQSDWGGLVIGLTAAALFVAIASGALWVLALLRCRPNPAFAQWQGLLLTAAGLAALALVPFGAYIFFPAWLAGTLVAQGSTMGTSATFALLALFATTVVVVALLAFVSSGTRLVVPLEEAALGRQVRKPREAPAAREPATWPVRGGPAQRAGPVVAPAPTVARWSPGGALFRKELLRLERMPGLQRLQVTVGPLVLGGATASALLFATQGGLRLEVLAPLCFFANFALIRLSMATLRVDLAHIDLYIGWPLSRTRLMLLDTLMGCALPLAGGEVALLAAGSYFATSAAVALWSVLWPLMLAASSAVALIDMARQSRRWAGSADTVPEIGPLVLALAGVVWLVALFLGPAAALGISAIVLALTAVLLRTRVFA